MCKCRNPILAVGPVLHHQVVDGPINGHSAQPPWDTLPVESKLCVTQVVCAGVWHNGLLCLTCWLSALLLPMLLLPLYSTGQGAVVWWVTQHSQQAISHRGCITICSINWAYSWQACCFRMHQSQTTALVPCTRSVPHQSALHSHLQPGDTITDVNGCTVRSTDSLRACIFAQVDARPESSHLRADVIANNLHVQLTL